MRTKFSLTIRVALVVLLAAMMALLPVRAAEASGCTPDGRVYFGLSGWVGHPVSTSFGEFYFDMPLLDLGGPFPIEFALHYASSMDKSSVSYNDPFSGDGFSHTLHISLKRWTPLTTTIFFGNGSVIRFERENARVTSWRVVEEEIPYQLRESRGKSTRYFLLDPASERVYTFDELEITGGRRADPR